MKVKLFAIGLGIALLLPLAVYTGVSIFVPAPENRVYAQDFEERKAAATTKQEKQQIAREEKLAQRKYDAQERRHQKVMFYVSFPIGVAAVIVGAFLSVPAVGPGLMFAGILLLAEGCYSYWDKMTAIFRFASVVVSFGVFVGLGYLKGRSWPTKPPEPAGT